MTEALTTLGKYQLRGELGRGAMGIVYRGFDPMIEREVAIKTLRSHLLESGEQDSLHARFKEEAKAAGRLNHRGIVQVYEYGEDEGRVFIAMELIRGRELKDYLSEQARFETTKIVRIARELLDALGYAHAHGVVHRDIKPSNVILLPDGHIKITDFGIARLESTILTQTGNVLGTPSYMSPEQFMGQRIDGRSDLFSAGVMLYELLTGEKPFVGNSFTTIMHKVMNETPCTPSTLNISLHPSFDQVLSKALAKRPDERFQNAGEFSRALDLALAGKMIAPPVDDMTVLATPGNSEETVLLLPEAVMPPPVGAETGDKTVVKLRAHAAESPGAGVPAAANKSPPPEQPVTRGKKWGPKIVLTATGVATLAGVAFFLLRPNADTMSIPQATSSAPPTGAIVIESAPPGAVVIVDNDRFMGVTPTRLNLPAGTHQISLKKDGHNALDSTVEVTSGKAIPFQAVLTPLE